MSTNTEAETKKPLKFRIRALLFARCESFCSRGLQTTYTHQVIALAEFAQVSKNTVYGWAAIMQDETRSIESDYLKLMVEFFELSSMDELYCPPATELTPVGAGKEAAL